MTKSFQSTQHLSIMNLHHLSFAVPFVKMQGIGNHFVVLDTLRHPLPSETDFSHLAQTLCAHHTSIGADGLLLLAAPNDNAKDCGAQVRMRMWNPDGSEDMCGNGLRCVARLAFARGYVGQRFRVQTLPGLRACEIIADDVRVEMGQPDFEFASIPFAPPKTLTANFEYSLPLKGIELPHVSSLSTGSTHTVVFVDELPDDETFLKLSPQIEHHAWFPQRTSVMWARVLDRENVQIRIWERGVQEANGVTGETLACGTGACAVAVAAQMTNRVEDRVLVHSRGGSLEIAWRKHEEISMTGAAEIVFQGVWDNNTEEPKA